MIDREDVDVNLNQPVVIDNGSGVMKAGFAGDDTLKCVFPSFVGKPKHHTVVTRLPFASDTEGESFIGKRAEELRGILTLRYAMSHGVVDHWDDMEAIWRHVYKQMPAQFDEHPVLLTEAPLNPRRNRERAAEVFFETFGCPALFVSSQAVLALLASGRTTGVVLDVGDGVAHSVPVYEGFALPHAIGRADVAGRDVTEQLMLQLRRAGYRLHTSAEREAVRQIKEQECYVAPRGVTDALGSSADLETRPFRLPDGSVVELGEERFRAPEVLFQPSLMGLEYPGVHEMLNQSIKKADMDLRMTLFSEIVLSGGSTMFHGFGDRLLSELKKLGPKNIKIRICAPPDRNFSTWFGGSMLAQLGTFKKMWISKDKYEEEGFHILHKKTF